MIKFKIKMEVIKNKLKKYLKASKKEKREILDHLSNSLELSKVQIIRNFKKLQWKIMILLKKQEEGKQSMIMKLIHC